MKTLHKFNNYYFFISDSSFSQHIIIRKEIRNYINTLINKYYILSNNMSIIVCMGGESYLYGLCNNFNYIVHYTNSKFIYNDAKLNNSIYKKKLENNIIDYNNFNFIKNGDCLILNLARLNINLLKQCNNRYYKFIIIINCHHTEFWKRIKYLDKYKILNRKQFIVSNYFVTVTILKYIHTIPIYISLGNTCAIAYQLNNLNLRIHSYPFDWCKINISQLNNVLDNNFNDYCDFKIIKFSNKHELLNHKAIGSLLLKNKYNITFAHELYSTSNCDIMLLENKINNRIINFLNLKNQQIYFVIHNQIINKNELNKLINNLNKYFYKFKIIYITNNTINNINIYKTINRNNLIIKFIDYNIINWADWTLSSVDWYKILYN